MGNRQSTSQLPWQDPLVATVDCFPLLFKSWEGHNVDGTFKQVIEQAIAADSQTNQVLIVNPLAQAVSIILDAIEFNDHDALNEIAEVLATYCRQLANLLRDIRPSIISMLTCLVFAMAKAVEELPSLNLTMSVGFLLSQAILVLKVLRSESLQLPLSIFCFYSSRCLHPFNVISAASVLPEDEHLAILSTSILATSATSPVTKYLTPPISPHIIGILCELSCGIVAIRSVTANKLLCKGLNHLFLLYPDLEKAFLKTISREFVADVSTEMTSKKLSISSLLRVPAFRNEVILAAEIALTPRSDDTAPLNLVWDKIKDTQVFKEPNVLDYDNLPPKQPGTFRVVVISDTHAKTAKMAHEIPFGDVFIHAGDFSTRGDLNDIGQFITFLNDLPHKHKFIVPGNHDVILDAQDYEEFLCPVAHLLHGKTEGDPFKARKFIESVPNTYILIDTPFSLNGYTFYGSPVTHFVYSWAFGIDRGQDMRRHWMAVPDNVDILITHCPPLGRHDLIGASKEPEYHGGDSDLLLQVQGRIQPLYHVFGHNHLGYGASSDGKTTFINASICTEKYEATNKPWVFDLPYRTK